MTTAVLQVTEPWPLLREAAQDSAFRRQQRAVAAASEALADQRRVEQYTRDRLLSRLEDLRTSLRARLSEQITTVRAGQVRGLLASVDALMAETTIAIASDVERAFAQTADLGAGSADAALRAAQLTILPTSPSLSQEIVTVAYDNTLDLLSLPMQQFRAEIASSVRRVALAGDNRMEEIRRLQRVFEDQGFSQAQYKAERLVRTELSRTFSHAAYERFLALEAQAPFLRKVWRATKDQRVRRGHTEAAMRYGRGRGLPIRERFDVTSYTRSGTVAGIVRLRFPLDPDATPAGRLAAAETILCRCAVVIDFDAKDFGAFARQRVSVAMTIPPGAGPPPSRTPPVAAAPPSVRRAPRVTTPAQPQGTRLSTRLLTRDAAVQTEARHALAAIDAVHGDGTLPVLPLVSGVMPDRRGWVEGTRGHGLHRMVLTPDGVRDHPQITLWHEVGHWLDVMALAKGGASHSGRVTPRPFGPPQLGPAPAAIAPYTRVGLPSSADVGNPLLTDWRATVLNAPSTQRLEHWARAAPSEAIYRAHPARYTGFTGDGVVPTDVSRTYLQYLLRPEELWARSYAQYIAIRSGQAQGLTQLRQVQRVGARRAVSATRRYAPETDQARPRRAWAYPHQWTDAEFRPIAEAIDALFETLGWRTRR